MMNIRTASEVVVKVEAIGKFLLERSKITHGYQVCEKWLKDRKQRTLTLDEIKIYSSIVTALSKTVELQKKIDKYFEEVEKFA